MWVASFQFQGWRCLHVGAAAFPKYGNLKDLRWKYSIYKPISCLSYRSKNGFKIIFANTDIKNGCDCSWQSLWMICQRGTETRFIPCLWSYPKLDNLKAMRNSDGVLVKEHKEESLGAPQSSTDRHHNIQWKRCCYHPLPTLCFLFCTVWLPSIFLSPIIIALPVFWLPYS